MLKLTITIEETETGVTVGIESGNDAECKKSSNREYILGKMMAKAIQGISPVLSSASEYEEAARMAAPLFKSFEKATETMFGKSTKDMMAAVKEAKARGEDIGSWLSKIAEEHAAEVAKDEPTPREAEAEKPEAEPEG